MPTRREPLAAGVVEEGGVNFSGAQGRAVPVSGAGRFMLVRGNNWKWILPTEGCTPAV